MGLIQLLQELLETSKRNAYLSERLINILENDGINTGDNFNNLDSLDSLDNFDDIYKHDIEQMSYLRPPSPIRRYRENNLVYADNEVAEVAEVTEVTEAAETNEANETDISQIENINEFDELIQRRIDYHKTQGTYKEHKDSYQPKKVIEPPKITPFSKLNKDDQNKLSYQIFQEAQHNVKNLMSVSEADPDYDELVNKEADRLLEVWMNANKH